MKILQMSYVHAPKSGPGLLSTTQAGPGRNFSQRRACLLVELCTRKMLGCADYSPTQKSQ